MADTDKQKSTVDHRSGGSTCYAAAAGVLLWDFSRKVKAVRPGSLVMMYFRDDGVMYDWSEIVTDQSYRWSHVITPEHFEMFHGSLSDELWAAWENQVRRKMLTA